MKGDIKTWLYIIFGVIPASLFGMPSALLLLTLNPKVILFVLSVYAAIAGLWLAALDNSTVISKRRLLIVALLTIGLVLDAPIAFTFAKGAFTEDSNYIIKYAMFIYFTIGPLLVAIHYIIASIIILASNKSLNQTGANDAPPG